MEVLRRLGKLFGSQEEFASSHPAGSNLASEIIAFIDEENKETAERKAREKKLFEETYRLTKESAKEIAELSGIRKILEQATVGLSRYYEGVTIAEKERLLSTNGQIDYLFRLAWRPKGGGKIREDQVWGHTRSRRDPEVSYIDVECRSWDNTLVVNECDYGGVLHKDELPNQEKVEEAVLRAIKRPNYQIVYHPS